MKLAGVVVLYHPDDNVSENIKSYIDCLEMLYVVDNTPADNSERFTGDKIKYLPNLDNVGIATALNIGANNALKDGFDWLLTMDQDSRFESGGLQELICFLENANKDTVTCNSRQIEFEKIGLVSPFHRTLFNKDQEVSGVDTPLMVMTSGNIINLRAYTDIGGFKDWLFIDTVDFDYCLNLRDHGYQILRFNDVELKHPLGDVVFKKIFGKQLYSLNHSPIRRYYIVRNRHYIYDLYHKKYPVYCDAEIRSTRNDVLNIILCEKQKVKKLLFMFKGYRDYKKGIIGKIS